MSTDTSQARGDARIFTLSELFSGADVYSIPRYQRNYAWGKPEIHQLILDLRDAWVSSDADGERAELGYYTGTLVVERRTADASFEVIDGQQRLTTLALLFGALKRKYQCTLPAGADKGLLLFSLRKAAEARLALLSSSIHQPPPAESGIDIDAAAQAIDQGYKYIADSLRELLPSPEEPQSLQPFADFILRHVRILRVELPKGADPIRYFEIMNSRGEQLEAHEVLKAELLGKLENAEDRQQFARIWNACANMDTYLPENMPEDAKGDSWIGSSDGPTLGDIIGSGRFDTTPENGEHRKPDDHERDSADQLASIIDFPNFLLLALSVFVNNRTDGTAPIRIPLDDKKLLEVFEEQLMVSPDPARIMQFVATLERCRRLLDWYVIKRDTRKQGENWTLKRRTKDALERTFDGNETTSRAHRRIHMLQTAFHVSAPSKSHKHWLHATLHWLDRHASRQTGALAVNAQDYLDALFSLAKAFMFDLYLGAGIKEYDVITLNQEGRCDATCASFPNGFPDELLSYGGKRNNFIFNFMDYLLWLRDGDETYASGFQFTFRNSVEHIAPQTMADEIRRADWGDKIHGFGNLCLISHEQNSRLGNLLPSGKWQYFSEEKQSSLKYRIIMKVIESNQEHDWLPEDARDHDNKMKALLLLALSAQGPDGFVRLARVESGA